MNIEKHYLDMAKTIVRSCVRIGKRGNDTKQVIRELEMALFDHFIFTYENQQAQIAHLTNILKSQQQLNGRILARLNQQEKEHAAN